MLKVINSTELLELDKFDQEWLIKDLIPRNEISLLFAPHSSYKTFTALAIGAIIMNESNSLGKVNKFTKENKVLYIPTEQMNTMKSRQVALKGKYGDKLPDIATDAINMLDPDSVRQICMTIQVGKYDLVIIDTVGKCIPSGDVSNEDTARKILTSAEFINNVGASVLLVHHTGHNELSRPKGSTLWLDSTSTVLSIKKSKSGKYNRNLHITKVKSMREGEKIPFKMEVVKVPELTFWANFDNQGADELENVILNTVLDQEIDRNTLRHQIFELFKDKYASADSFRKVFNNRIDKLAEQEKILIFRSNSDVMIKRNQDI